MPRTVAITWLDLIIAALIIMCGCGGWAVAESVVSYALHGKAPDKQEFLAGKDVRILELKLKNTQAELDGARKSWVEQRLGDTKADQVAPKLAGLEMSQLAAEKNVADARRQATFEFERRSLLFLVVKHAVTLLLGVVATVAVFVIIWRVGSVITRRLQLKPCWPIAMSVASIVLAPVFGYQTAGAAGAAVAAAIAVLLIFRP